MTKVLFTHELFDTSGEFDTTNSRWTPQTPGKYLITFASYYNAPITGEVQSYIKKNGAVANSIELKNSAAYNGPIVSTIVSMNGTTDYVEFFAAQYSGSAKDLYGGATWTYATGSLLGVGPKGDIGPQGPAGADGAAGAAGATVLKKAATQAISSATFTTISFAAADVQRDDLTAFDDANDAIVVPSSGVYAVFAGIHYTTSLAVGEICQARIYVNGASSVLFFDTAGTTSDCAVSGATLLSLNAGDIVKLIGYKAGAAGTIANSGGTFLHLSAIGNGPQGATGATGATGPAGDETGVVEFIIDGGGVAITTGLKGYLEIPYACTITEVALLADRSGSIVVDIWKCSYANFNPGTHPVAADKITASAPPTISSSYKSKDSTLTGWSKSFAAGDIVGFNVNSVSTIQRVTLSMKVGP